MTRTVGLLGAAALPALGLALLCPSVGSATVEWHPVPPSAAVKSLPSPRDDRQFVTLACRRLLGREPRPMETERWLGLLGEGKSGRVRLILELFSSDEFFVRQSFERILGRLPEEEELRVRLRHLGGGGRRKAVIENLLESSEYRDTLR